MESTNMGSFGAATGGTDALRAAMQRRGLDTSILDQVSATAPSGPSQVAPDITGAMPEVGSPDQARVATAARPQEPKLPFRSAEAEIALKALKSTVDTENKIAEVVMGLQ